MSARQPAGTSQTTTLGEFGLSLQELTLNLLNNLNTSKTKVVLITAVEPDALPDASACRAGQ